MKKILFYRDFKEFSGGHLKVWDYFNHTKASGICEPVIYMTPVSLSDMSNPWVANGETVLNDWMPKEVDALFIGGMDWLAVPEDYTKPVINLVQGIRHADPGSLLFGFLQRPATRICVSQEVADAITSTGKVNGPVFTIRNGLSTVGFPTPTSERDIKVLIAGYKHPELATQLATTFEADGIKVQCLTKQIARHEYLSLVARASVTVFLPYEIEGFYLPALEGMALGTFVVCPDCIGSQGFCFHEGNCLQPTYDLGSIVASCQAALVRISNGSAESILSAAFRQVHQHSIDEERRLFLRVLSALLRSNSK
jgi:glycosyltransferase involved in cell wall biosynthesis